MKVLVTGGAGYIGSHTVNFATKNTFYTSFLAFKDSCWANKFKDRRINTRSLNNTAVFS